MLFAWFPITALIFRRWPEGQAVVISVLWGYLLLPEKIGINLPVLPTFDKVLVPSLAAMLCLLLARRKSKKQDQIAARRARLRDQASPENGGVDSPKATRKSRRQYPRWQRLCNLVVVMLIVACFVTWRTNREPLFYGPLVLPAMRPYDTLAMAQNLIVVLLPFWLARATLGRRDVLISVLKVFVIAGLFYSVLVLIEWRLSPQLHRWVYGFHTHSFAQHVRGGQFRAMGFVGHGLRVGMFLCLATMAAAILVRGDPNPKNRVLWLFACLWFFPILYLSRNLGATMLAMAFVPLILMTGRRVQLLAAASLSAIVLIYPLARGAGLIPIDAIIDQAERINPARAQSLSFRLDNEDLLLEHANEKPLAGWGLWSRNRVFDDRTGRDLSVTDGSWIIQIGVFGWLGYLGRFFLLCMPPILLALRGNRQNSGIEAGIGLMVTANLVDLIPNSSLVAPLFLLAGALWAVLGQTQSPPEMAVQPPKYSRKRRAVSQ
ncbi:hypothetical protein [Aestuariibius sp. HNIBRBA575]|uniref:hypothetical protein n=1 Tax=Aestuariibius sp. HNIBRBA575 TaxID=3233343 RepID=UPI0034A49DEE